MTVESEEIGAVTVSTGAVTVEKSFTDDEFPVPTVVFDIRSTASEAVEIRLTDDVPESVEMSAIGFHPDYDGDSWTAFRDRRVRYETTIEPEGSVRTVYGVRADEDVRPEEFLGEPRLELEGEEATEGADAPVHEPSGSVHDALATDETEPDETEPDVDVPSVDEAAAEGAGEGATAPASEDLAAALAEAIREDAVADEDLETLKEAIGSKESVPTSVQVRIDRLQNQVQDLVAYTEALETFLDEEGEGAQAVAGFRADLNEATAEVATLTDAVESLDERVVDVESTADATAAEVETLSENLDAVDEEVSTVSADLGALDEEVETLSENLDAVDEEVTTVSEDLDALDEEVTTVADDLEETREAAEEMRDEIDERLRELSERVDDVEDETGEHAEEIERLNEFRERLNSAFGPGPGGDGSPDESSEE